MEPRLTLAEPEMVEDGDEPSTTASLALRDPRVPATLDDLAALRGHALEVLDARILVLETARKRAIKITFPSDWNLYRAPEGQVVGYLHDAGCERVRDILSIEIFNVSRPEKIMAADGGSFVYVQRGSGRSRLTMQTVEEMEGGRGSMEDFCKDKTGAELELLVRKACRANLDGNIARELMGMKSVPLDELVDAWKGTSKDWNQCHKARGFGSQAERLGATREGAPDVTPPDCPVCNVALKYRAASGTRKAFYGCANYQKHPQQKVIVDAAAWVTEQQKQQRDLAEDAKRQDAETAAREPGAEG